MISALASQIVPSRGLFNLEPPTLDASDNVIRGGMWPSQRAWWDLPNFVRLFVGGYGSGKTLQLCKRHIVLALANAPVATAIVSPTYSMAQETVVSTTIGLLEGQRRLQAARGGFLDYKFRKTSPSQFEIYHIGVNAQGKRCKPKLGRILIYSGENPERLKGPNLSSAGIDEPFIQDYEVFRQLIARVRHKDAVRCEVNLTGTPEQLNWGYDLAEGDLRDKHDVGIVQASTMENKALAKGYVQRLLEMFDAKTAQAYIHGYFVNLATGLVYYAFDRMENVIDLDMPPQADIGVGMDFNVNPMTATPFWYTTRGSTVLHLHYFDEIELANSDTQAMCGELRDRYWNGGYTKPFCTRNDNKKSDTLFLHKGLRDVFPDSNVGRHSASPGGKTDYDYIQDAGFEITRHVKGNPPVRDRYNATNNMLRPNAGRVRMTVSPRCKKLIKALSTYTHEGIRTESMKKLSHILDAGTYPVSMLCPSDRDTLKFAVVRGT